MAEQLSLRPYAVGGEVWRDVAAGDDVLPVYIVGMETPEGGFEDAAIVAYSPQEAEDKARTMYPDRSISYSYFNQWIAADN